MLKILLIDRCYFTRLGLEIWLNQAGLFSTPVVVTGLNSLMSTKEPGMQTRPALVIAEHYGFRGELHHIQQLSSLRMACSDRSKLMLAQSGQNANMENYCQKFPISAGLAKTDSLAMLAQSINTALLARPIYAEPQTAAPLLTRQEEKVLSLWMEGTNNHCIASRLGINGKTVYTYKRNIRMKLGRCNRFTPFLSLPEGVR
ncbi:LuxR C-terminal-related transcriptional regulator [Neisseria meningitidis]|uniref:helix-turn-helix domain-containing protein n=1 Tax=Neisseria meningitidis TaxID=487 RepID=UPI0021F205B4|nr:LuxR C-terminal-related transcriptional regulator [Neisseria meningitidis]MCV6721542.1 LuxR C-terminal-related transcriptional regulator [Neisseria meningitidis]